MRLAGWLMLALLVAGCEDFAPPMPDWIVNRQPLDGCAEGVVEDGSAEAARAQQCMLEAYREGRGAELITTGEMETGDPMTTYLRVHRNGTIEMFHNLGSDPSAAGSWERMRCETLVPTELVRGPTDGAFTVTGCEMLPLP